MKINLHFPPEMPARSCEVLGFHYNVQTGHIYTAMSCEYSAAYGLFNCFDEISHDNFTKREEDMKKYTASIIAWAYMDEVTQGVFDEIHG